MLNLLYANDTKGAYPPSWYAETATPFAALDPLRGKITADVCVIGGGYTGLSAALELAERGYDVVLLEAQRIGFGASGRNGGQVGSGQRLEQDALEKMVGDTRARALWEMGEAAKALVQERIAAHDIKADYRAGIAHACWTQAEVKHAHHAAEHLAKRYGYDKITPLDKAALRAILPSDAYQGGDIDRGAGHLHPLNYALGLARAALAAGVRIFEGSEVHRIDHALRPFVATAHGGVTCDHVILGANGYLGALEPKVAARVMPINNFIVATEPLGDRAAEILAEPIAVAAPRGYGINVGLFADPANARRALVRIRQAGVPARSDTLQLERGPRTRVRAGPFASRAEADQAAARIKALGLEAQVFRQDGRE